MNKIPFGRIFRPRLLQLRELLRQQAWLGLCLWAVPIGLVGALVTALFRLALYQVDKLVFGMGGSLVALARSLAPWERLLAPAVGGLLAGLLLQWSRKIPTGNAATDYMEASAMGDGRIPVVLSVARSAASLLSIVSGGSIGREGPMVQLAALCASVLGQWRRLPAQQLRLLVACGAAAGITSAYSAPLASAFFVAEIVIGSLAAESLGPIIVSAVVANLTMRALPGYQPPYVMPVVAPVQSADIALFVLLGLVCGAAAALFLRGLEQSRQLFAGLGLALPVRLALGGLVVGVLSLAWPEVWGNGYSVVNASLHAQWAWSLLLTLLLAKVLATLATVGSGAVGGIFTPALFIGCMVGGIFGSFVHALWPAWTSEPAVYAIAGMGAVLAGSAQAPLMAIVMLIEMTLSYQVILPLMAGCVMAYFVARAGNAGAMYQITSRRLAEQEERVRLRQQHVSDFLQPAVTVVPADAGLDAMAALFAAHPVKYIYVVDAANQLLGVVPLKKLGAVTAMSDLAHKRAVDLVSHDIQPLTHDMTLPEALARFMQHQGERLPVVQSAQEPQLLGVVHKSTLLSTYARLSG